MTLVPPWRLEKFMFFLKLLSDLPLYGGDRRQIKLGYKISLKKYLDSADFLQQKLKIVWKVFNCLVKL